MTRNRVLIFLAAIALAATNAPAQALSFIISTVRGAGGGSAFAVDAAGILYVANGSSISRISNGVAALFAGQPNTIGFQGDGGMAAQALFGGNLNGLAFDSVGNLFITDSDNSRIRKVSPGGIISTFAGGGSTPPDSLNGAPVTNARLGGLGALTIDSSDSIIFAENPMGDASVIRIITPNGILSTLAGQTTSLNAPYGDGGPPLSAYFSQVSGLSASNGSILIADRGHNRIRTLSGGVVTTLVGNGMTNFFPGVTPLQSGLNAPTGVTYMNGSIIVADSGDRRVIAAGSLTSVVAGAFVTTTFDSGDGGDASQATLASASAVLVSRGSLYILEQTSVRLLTPTIPPPLPVNALLIPQFAAGNLVDNRTEWATNIYLTNVSTSSENYAINFYDAKGNALQVPIQGSGNVSVLSGVLTPGQTQVIQSGASPNLVQGWAVISPTTAFASRLSGFAVFQHLYPDPSANAVVPFGSSASKKYVIPYDNNQGFITTVALANPIYSGSANITATVRDLTGATIGTADTITLPAFGQISFQVSSRYPLTANQAGTIEFSSPSALAGMGFQFGPNTTFSSFPLLTSPDIQ